MLLLHLDYGAGQEHVRVELAPGHVLLVVSSGDDVSLKDRLGRLREVGVTRHREIDCKVDTPRPNCALQVKRRDLGGEEWRQCFNMYCPFFPAFFF